MKKKRKIVLAYSGGLDTSVILRWLQEKYNAEVITYTADIGQKIDKKKIINNAKKLGIEHALFIRSSMPFEDLAQHFRSADLVVYPSYYEGQGLIPLEAMASGTPVVTVDDGPLPEMVDDSVGGLFDIDQPETLAKTIESLLQNHDGRQDMAKKGRKRVLDEYTYALNAERYAEFYTSSD